MSDITNPLAKPYALMGLIRFVTFLLILWILWFMARNYLRKQRHQGATPRIEAGKIVKCRQCDLHLPAQDALCHDDAWFCSRAHMQAYLSGEKDT